MNEEILINVTPRETRVAMVENGVLQELFIERTSKRGLVGNIYRGKVVRVLPGMQAAFIDIGRERTAFLHASDIIGRAKSGNGSANGKSENGKSVSNIVELLHQGQELLVQVVKDPLGSKGARLTTQLSVAARFLVYMPDEDHIGISQKIEGEAERQRLRDLLGELSEEMGGGGYIVRTVADGVSDQELRADVEFLHKLWQEIQEREKTSSAGALVHGDLSLVMRTMRDQVDIDIEKIRIDSRENYEKAKKFASKFIPEMAERIEYYPGERPIFDIYGIEDEIQKALSRKVQLKSGGYLIVDQTEALTTIDVNTGAYVGSRNLEETIFKTNLEAAQGIARQLRLRNLGGIVILDFIDMTEAEHKRQVMRALEKALEKDHARTSISEVSSLGLVEMTRKRTRESLEHVLCGTCPTCEGRGTIKTAETVCYEIFREILREARQFDAKELLVLAAQDVVDMLVDEESNSLAELEDFIGIPIKFQAEALFTQEQFDVVIL
jgi:ribonuclease G